MPRTEQQLASTRIKSFATTPEGGWYVPPKVMLNGNVDQTRAALTSPSQRPARQIQPGRWVVPAHVRVTGEPPIKA